MSKARQLADLGNVYDDGALSNRNLIINGAMQVAQRSISATFQDGTGGYLTNDRWLFSEAGTDSFVFAVTQSTDAPDGFANSMKLDCTTADASFSSASNQINIEQKIEGQNLQHLNYGSSAAKALTLSFWVKSNKTGTYIAWFYQDASTRSVSATYTINSANTWEKKTITIEGDASGQIDNNNGSGLRVRFVLSAGPDYQSGTLQTTWGASTNANRYAGQVNLADTLNNYWQITGVQLEVGDTATPFEHRSYGDELARCQRYYIKGKDDGLGVIQRFTAARTDRMDAFIPFPVRMRAIPTTTHTASSASYPMIATQDAFSVYIQTGLSGSSRNLNAWDADAEL